MRALLGLAAAAAAAITISTPALARDRDRAFVGTPRVDAGQFARPSLLDGRLCRDFRRDGDGNLRRRNLCRSGVILDWYGGQWALYNNRSWEPDSYNDWWNDRPDRAYPAWMRRNEGCQRQWFSGDVLTC